VSDLVLVPAIQALRALRDRRVRLHVLAPPGAWLGCGTLRVLRLKMPVDGDPDDAVKDEREVELIVGYESYRQ
jgi:hypothetical protein